MRRYWSDQDLSIFFQSGELVDLRDDLFHHIVDVCRQDIGSKFEFIGLDGLAYLSEIIELKKKSAKLKLLEGRKLPQPQPPFIHLVLCVPRFPVLEAVIEKATELGVQSIHLVFPDYSFVHDLKMISENKWDRWNKIVVSATQQSGRGNLMKIHTPIPLENFLKSFNQDSRDFGLFAYELQTDQNIQQYLRSTRPKSVPDNIFVFVGGEGGFSQREVNLFKSFNLTPVSLGEQVLRVETACISLVSILKYEFGL